MKDQNIINSFTPAQIEFVKAAVFDALASRFNQPYGESKRKKVMAIAFNAQHENYDALIQRAIRLAADTPVCTPSANTGVKERHKIDSLQEKLRSIPEGGDASEASIDNLRQRDWQFLTRAGAVVALSADPAARCLAKITSRANFMALLDTVCPVEQASLLLLLKRAIDFGHTTVNILSVAAEDFDNGLPDLSLELTNDNCLSNMRCPACGEEGGFRIDTRGTDPEAEHDPSLEGEVITYSVRWEDDGSIDDTYGDTELPDGGNCQCLHCRHQQPIEAFFEVLHKA